MALDIKTVLADPEFQAASLDEQRNVLESIDPEFKQLKDPQLAQFTGRIESQRGISPEELVAQTRAGVGQFPQRVAPPAVLSLVPGIGPALSLALAPESEAFARGVLSGGTAGLTEAVGQRLAPAPITAEDIQFQAPIATMLGEIVGGVSPTGRLIRGAQTLGQLSRLGAQAVGALGGAAGLSSALEGEQPVEFQEALLKTLGGGALGALGGASFGAIGGALAAKVAKEAPERILRAAIKPQKAVGQRVETATKDSISDIFHANPNADKAGSMPLEGFNQTVSELKASVGREINSGLSQQGQAITAGDDLAKILNSRADRMERSGAPAADVQMVRNRAQDFVGKVTDFESLQDVVTTANRARSPLFMRAKQQVAPQLAEVDNIINEVISKEGGSRLNKALETVGGERGAQLRKQWSNLTLIEQQTSDRLNTLINSAPAEIQPSLVGALTSIEGVAGLVGLLQGYAAGAIPLATSAAKAWAKRSDKLLRDSNALVTSAYEKLRANPPKPRTFAPAIPPVITQPPAIPAAPYQFPTTPIYSPVPVTTGPTLQSGLQAVGPRVLSPQEIALQMAQPIVPSVPPQVVPGGIADILTQALGGGPVPPRLPIPGATAEQMSLAAQQQALQDALRRVAIEQGSTVGNF